MRVERIDLPLRDREVCLRCLERRLLLMQLGRKLLGVLHRARASLRQRPVTSRLLLCEYEVRLRLLHLCLAGIDLRLLDTGLRLNVLDIGLRGRHLRLGLVEGNAVVARVDARDHVAGGDVLVVRDRHRRDGARHLRRHRELTRCDEGIIGRLEGLSIIPVDVPSGRCQCEEDHADRDSDRMASQETLVIFVPDRISGLPRAVRLVRRRVHVATLAIVSRRRPCLDGLSSVQAAELALGECRRRAGRITKRHWPLRHRLLRSV